MEMYPERPRIAVAMSLESFVARDAYFVGAVQMALDEAAAARVALAWTGPPVVSAAVVASDATASARAVGFLASALRVPVLMTDIYSTGQSRGEAIPIALLTNLARNGQFSTVSALTMVDCDR
jgi:hypothetical protein